LKQSKGLIKRASNTQKRASHDFQVIFLLVLSCKQWSKEQASQPQQDSALDQEVVLNSYG
jgi:hypothetical protein